MASKTRPAAPEPRPDEAPAGEAQDLTGESIECGDGGIASIQAEQVTARRCAITGIEARHVGVRQSAVRTVTAEGVDVLQGAVGSARAESVLLRGSAAAVVGTRGTTSVDQSAAGLVLSSGDVVIDSSPTIGVVARNVNARDSKALFLIAQRVEGTVRPLFGTRQALLFGLGAGAALLVARLLAQAFRRD